MRVTFLPSVFILMRTSDVLNERLENDFPAATCRGRTLLDRVRSRIEGCKQTVSVRRLFVSAGVPGCF